MYGWPAGAEGNRAHAAAKRGLPADRSLDQRTLPISLVVPAWNEERRIGATLDRLLFEASALGIEEVSS